MWFLNSEHLVSKPRIRLRESNDKIFDGAFDEENGYSNWDEISIRDIEHIISTFYDKKLVWKYEDRNWKMVEFCPLFIEIYYLDKTVKHLSVTGVL